MFSVRTKFVDEQIGWPSLRFSVLDAEFPSCQYLPQIRALTGRLSPQIVKPPSADAMSERKRYECSFLPHGWKREELCRKSGISAGKIDVLYYRSVRRSCALQQVCVVESVIIAANCM